MLLLAALFLLSLVLDLLSVLVNLLDAGRLGGGRWWRLGLQQRLNGEHDGTAHLLRQLVELQGLHSTNIMYSH